MQVRRVCLVLLLLLMFSRVFPETNERFTFEFLPGSVYALPCSLHIYQQGQPDIHLIAKYRTEPFTLPIYYSCRLGYSYVSGQTFELEFNHLKIFLANKPYEVKAFSISHGYNQFWLNYAYSVNNVQFRVGLGSVIAHPESVIRGKELSYNQGLFKNGYYLSGITSQLACQQKFRFGKHFFLSVEGKVNGAWAKVPVVEGHAVVPVVALHGLVGVGVAF